MAPHIDAEETDYGVRIFSLRDVDGRTFFRVTNFVFPNKATIPGPMSGDGYNLYWHVPIDDTHHWRYDFVFRRSAPMEERDIERDQEILDELDHDYRPKRNKANRYLQDRESMKTWSFSGMGRIFNVHDIAVVEGCGPIVDRTKEFLGPQRQRHHRRAPPAACERFATSKPAAKAPNVVREHRRQSFPATHGGLRSPRRHRLARPLAKQARSFALTLIVAR